MGASAPRTGPAWRASPRRVRSTHVNPRRPRLLSDSLLVALLLASALAGCELIADFDGDELPGSTTPVRPLPVLDGAMPVLPDSSVRDAALVTDRPDAAASAGDASAVFAPLMDAGA